MTEPTTEAGQRLLAELKLPYVTEPSNRGMADREWLHAILAIEQEARADLAARIVAAVEGLDTWPRVSWFAYEPEGPLAGVNPTEDRVVVDRAAVLDAIREARR